MAKKRRIPKFKGWDYTEIAKPLRIKLPLNQDSAKWWRVRVDHISKELWARLDIATQSWPKGEVRICRAYLKALVKAPGGGYDAPAILGILAIKDDYTFMQWFTNNLGRFWS